jgi:hypothetical protein
MNVELRTHHGARLLRSHERLASCARSDSISVRKFVARLLAPDETNRRGRRSVSSVARRLGVYPAKSTAVVRVGEVGNANDKNRGSRVSSIKLGLGLKSADYRGWAAKKGFSTYDQLVRVKAKLEKLNTALEVADELHFNTEGLYENRIRLGAEIDEFGEPAVGWTNYELSLLKLIYKSKTYWWEGDLQDQALDRLRNF